MNMWACRVEFVYYAVASTQEEARSLALDAVSSEDIVTHTTAQPHIQGAPLLDGWEPECIVYAPRKYGELTVSEAERAYAAKRTDPGA